MPSKILFMTYDDMKSETFVHVKRLEDFFGQPFSLEVESKGFVEEIIELCSFVSLSNLGVNKNGFLDVGVKKNVFFREGKLEIGVTI